MTQSARPLTRGVSLLAKAAGKPQAPGTTTKVASFVLAEPPEALADDEVLIAVADARSVALKRIRIPAVQWVTEEGHAALRLQELARRLAGIEVVADEISRTRGGETGVPPALTAPEEGVLRSTGLDPRPLGSDEIHLLHRATADYARLLDESYTVEQAAHLLDVNNSRIRQRLAATPRTLYGVKFGRTWRIPRFQFHGRRLVPGVDTVVQRLPANLHPVAVYRWFTSPNPDLTRDDEEPISPLDWLRLGNSADVVAELAADL